MPSLSLSLPATGTVIASGLHVANYTAIQSLLNGGLDANNMTALAVTESRLANEAVTTTKIFPLAVTTAKLADLSVTNAKLGNGAVFAEKLKMSGCTVYGADTWAVSGWQSPASLTSGGGVVQSTVYWTSGNASKLVLPHTGYYLISLSTSHNPVAANSQVGHRIMEGASPGGLGSGFAYIHNDGLTGQTIGATPYVYPYSAGQQLGVNVYQGGSVSQAHSWVFTVTFLGSA